MTEADITYKHEMLYNYLKFYRCFPEIVDAVSQQSDNVASMRPQFGVLDVVRPNQVSHYLPAKEQLFQEIELQKQIFLEQKNN